MVVLGLVLAMTYDLNDKITQDGWPIILMTMLVTWTLTKTTCYVQLPCCLKLN